ncbi:PAS domain S-box protein [Vibrio sinaloensis]|nr:PAS domain S-box protein [Vibrio sinaloensis]
MNDQSLNRDYCATSNLISTTDPSSYITHANKAFCDIAGFSNDELIGNPHNMVRHKDMPKQAFAQMWTYLKQGKSWMGLVKTSATMRTTTGCRPL